MQLPPVFSLESEVNSAMRDCHAKATMINSNEPEDCCLASRKGHRLHLPHRHRLPSARCCHRHVQRQGTCQARSATAAACRRRDFPRPTAGPAPSPDVKEQSNSFRERRHSFLELASLSSTPRDPQRPIPKAQNLHAHRLQRRLALLQVRMLVIAGRQARIR